MFEAKSKGPVVICFPGFMGLPSDFKALANISSRLDIVDVCGRDAPKDGQSWEDWKLELIEKFNLKYRDQKVAFVGYSMGARIVLSLLNSNPKFVVASVLLSCHPGLLDLKEREDRARSDFAWSKSIRDEPWKVFIDKWNNQPSLLGSAPLDRCLDDYDRNSLARVMEVFSLSKQAAIKTGAISIPTLICWGQRDLKFKKLANLLGAYFESPSYCEILNSGHRVMADNPGELTGKIAEFIP